MEGRGKGSSCHVVSHGCISICVPKSVTLGHIFSKQYWILCWWNITLLFVILQRVGCDEGTKLLLKKVLHLVRDSDSKIWSPTCMWEGCEGCPWWSSQKNWYQIPWFFFNQNHTHTNIFISLHKNESQVLKLPKIIRFSMKFNKLTNMQLVWFW
jgi:hypothetical protein